MRKRKLLFTMLALGLGAFLGGSGAMAQNGWESIYQQSQTSSPSWTVINSGSSSGLTLGDGENTTRYYYVNTNNLNFTNSTAGGSGLTISGTVYLYIPTGFTITCRGANASGTTGAGAGIELAAGNTLYIIGGGTVKAYGGNAANGGDGGKGQDASLGTPDPGHTGNGGQGGDGGGGAGAGIGTRGGNGGSGGNGGEGDFYYETWTYTGNTGDNGGSGVAAGSMGTLYIASGIAYEAHGGIVGTAGSGGKRGYSRIYDGGSNYSCGAGGGGGAGGFGSAASNIGTGGTGGGGGGGGASGSVQKVGSDFAVVLAYAGHGGKNADGPYDPSTIAAGEGTFAPDGEESGTTWWMIANGYCNNGDGDSWDEDDEYRDNKIEVQGGLSGGSGVLPSAGSVNEGNLTYKITFNPIKTDLSGVTGLTKNTTNDTYEMTYSPGAPNIVLPANTEGYNWVLQVYGKSCAPDGVTANTFATATTEYFGGNGDETSRTITPINVYGDLVFQEVATMLMMECSTSTSGEDTNNDQEIAEFYTYRYNVTVRLQNRTLYRDNHWNTICLPFAMTPAQIAASPLAGAKIVKLNESTSGYYGKESEYKAKGYDHPVVLFWFDSVNPNTATLEAGQPYLVKWTEGSEWTTDHNYVDNTAEGGSRHELDFPGVRITVTSPGVWEGSATTSGNVTFQGTFSLSADLDDVDTDGNMNLVLGANDTLYHPSSTINVGACRGYFKIPAAAVNGTSAPQFVMGFDDDETTGIRTIDITPEGWNNAPAIYNLSGQRLNSLQKGVNIVNGKKVVIK